MIAKQQRLSGRSLGWSVGESTAGALKTGSEYIIRLTAFSGMVLDQRTVRVPR